MKILVVANLYHPYVIGGAEISTKILVEKLAETGHEVSVLTSFRNELIERINGIEVHRIKNNIYWSYEKDRKTKFRKVLWHLIDDYNFIIVRRLRKILSSNNYDILISSTLEGFSGITGVYYNDLIELQTRVCLPHVGFDPVRYGPGQGSPRVHPDRDDSAGYIFGQLDVYGFNANPALNDPLDPPPQIRPLDELHRKAYRRVRHGRLPK